jgi:hypothetical protein
MMNRRNFLKWTGSVRPRLSGTGILPVITGDSRAGLP